MTDKKLLKVKSDFGSAVKMQRNSIGISQEHLAELAGMDRTYVSSIERGRRNPSLINILKLSTALNITPGDLFSEPKA